LATSSEPSEGSDRDVRDGKALRALRRARICCAPRSSRANRLRSGLEREAAVEERDDAGLPLLVSPDGQTQSVISGLVAVPVLAVEWEPGAA
jgi:hypothetical protein